VLLNRSLALQDRPVSPDERGGRGAIVCAALSRGSVTIETAYMIGRMASRACAEGRVASESLCAITCAVQRDA